MARLLGTPVFWTTIFSIPLILAVMTIVGRPWSAAFPARLQRHARFYLAPALGLATFVVVSSIMGRHVPLGDTVTLPILLLIVLVCALKFDAARSELPRQLLTLAVFGILCGTSVLAPLYLHGAINAHNDTFTYLAHSDWLQHNAFANLIPAEEVTPAGTQVLLYQLNGFRMGASYLLGFFQALLNLRWSYDAYPAVVIAAMTTCCLAIGFPVARLLARLTSGLKLGLLALPSFSLGGLVFGANQGFLPQTVGLAVGAGAIVAAGAAMTSLAETRKSFPSMLVTALPAAVLLTATLYAYAEIAPFLFAAIGLGGLIHGLRVRAWRNICVFGLAVAVLVFGMSNFELLRAYHSLKIQSATVVGSPVDWSLAGFIGHAMGLRAGAWDSDAFTAPALLWSIVASLVIISSFRSIRWRAIRATMSSLGLVLALLGLLACGFVYFRYGVVSPFSTGKGQSWSQFKLMEWTHPFVSVFVLAVMAGFLGNTTLAHRRVLAGLLVIAVFSSSYTGLARTQNLRSYYGDIVDLEMFYRDFRQAVNTSCPRGASIYLALDEIDHKFRQMASLYLADRDVISNWAGDDYIGPHMAAGKAGLALKQGDCLVEPIHRAISMTAASTIGPVRVGVYDGRQQITIASVAGAHALETDGSKSWRWIEHEATFTFKPFAAGSGRRRLALDLEYQKFQDLPLMIEITDGVGPPVNVEVGNLQHAGSFRQEIEVETTGTLKVSVATDAKPQPLGPADHRQAAFMIRNLSVMSIKD